jgi:hypothetical protein
LAHERGRSRRQTRTCSESVTGAQPAAIAAAVSVTRRTVGRIESVKPAAEAETYNLVVADFNAVRVTNRLHAHLLVGVFRRGFERLQRFRDETFRRPMHRHFQMPLDLRGSR